MRILSTDVGPQTEINQYKHFLYSPKIIIEHLVQKLKKSFKISIENCAWQ